MFLKNNLKMLVKVQMEYKTISLLIFTNHLNNNNNNNNNNYNNYNNRLFILSCTFQDPSHFNGLKRILYTFKYID